MISDGGSLSAYLATLDRLEPLIEGATWVVPGHSMPIDPVQAAAVLREDRAYLEALRDQGAGAHCRWRGATRTQKGHARGQRVSATG
jgi:glyoxylase-like metal-dependent hydrolase (beta-lactamase superfamily II)